jgi:hypothetical protein
VNSCSEQYESRLHVWTTYYHLLKSQNLKYWYLNSCSWIVSIQNGTSLLPPSYSSNYLHSWQMAYVTDQHPHPHYCSAYLAQFLQSWRWRQHIPLKRWCQCRGQQLQNFYTTHCWWETHILRCLWGTRTLWSDRAKPYILWAAMGKCTLHTAFREHVHHTHTVWNMHATHCWDHMYTTHWTGSQLSQIVSSQLQKDDNQSEAATS